MENAGSAAMLRLTGARSSAERPHLSHLDTLWAALALICLTLVGCASPDHPASLGSSDAGPDMAPPTVGACETPNQGCDCDKPGDVVDCGQVERVSGDYVSCSMGQRTCEDGKWGACIGDSISTLHIPAGQRRTLGLGTGMTCPDNPCDPYCRVVIDTPNQLGLPIGSVFTEDGGLQVLPTQQAGGQGSCQSMTVKPTPQTLTVTSIGARGIIGEYFKQVDQDAAKIPTSWVPFATRIDPYIDFSTLFGDTGVPGLGGENYSIRWTGAITAPTTGSYTLCVQSDDGNRVWIDGSLISNVWYIHGAGEDCSTPFNWVAGSTHSVRFEFFQVSGGTRALLTWSSETISKQAIPQSAYGVIGSDTPVVNGTANFGVEVAPDSCFPGTPKPAWTVDRLDVATIDESGQVGLISPVAGPITVTAYLGTLSATGQVNVKVDAENNDAAPAGVVDDFQNPVSGTDPARILYPYDQTVYPLGLRAPVLQWDNQGISAAAVKITLQYPSTGAPEFRWSEIVAESDPPQATIPAEVWNYFGRSAKGHTASFSIQRLIGATPRPALTRSITFSSAPVRGKIYYTQYHRGGNPSEMVADPGSENPPRAAFTTTDNCPVCHTLSANGNVFATTSKYGYYDNNYSSPITFSPTLGGVSKVNSDGSLSPIADFIGGPPRTNYTVGSKDWRGFAWAPLTPDGKYALAANNFWGNTNQALVGIDPATRKVNTGSAMLSGGSGIGLLAQYYPSVDYTGTAWKRVDPQINFDFGTGAPGGLITVDYSVKRVGQIQSYFSELYKFEVVSTASDTFSLTVGNTTVSGGAGLVANVPLTAGALVPFELDQINLAGGSNVQVYWSSPSTPRALIPQSQLYLPASEPEHGANVSYANISGGPAVPRIEPDIASDWSTYNPAPGIGANSWTSTWDAQVESPYDGPVQLCVESDDGVILTVNGATVINSATSYNDCAAAQSWVAGNKYTIHIVHTDNTGAAHLILKYRYGSPQLTEVIPTTNLYPLTPPSTVNGLNATYYDLDGFNYGLTASQRSPRAFRRVDPNIDFDLLSGRPNYSVINDDGNFSARWTGQIKLDCPGVGLYEFASDGAVDGGRLWIDDVRVMGRWNSGSLSGAARFASGTHDFKFDWHSTSGNTAARLRWRTPCAASPDFVAIPSSAFVPSTSYARTTGYVTDGGDNGNGSNYWVWELPTTAAPTPKDVTGESAGNWGLAGNAMMVPSFSPDGRKLVFIDGDSGGGAGWRKGLSTFDFDQNAKEFSNRRLLTSTWPRGDVLKWPTFESDSRSVIFQSTVPGDACCRNNWTKYGFMGPTNYYEDPGRLWSIDATAATPTPVELTKLNSGEQPKDANKSYQPTMLPSATGGYRWVVFTSTRPYGNSANLPSIQQDFSDTSRYADSSYTAMTNTADFQSQLWVAAIDDASSGTTDRSHPAFWLPNQNFSADAGSGYINERGFWVLDACHPTGSTAAASCEVDEDCCGGAASPKAAACRLDTPLTTPPTRHCRALPAPGDCGHASSSCGTTSDCCAGLVCLAAQCQAPPDVLAVSYQNYERVYHSDCPDGTKVVWRFFDWQTVTPATDSRLEIFAETQADPTMFSVLPVAPNAVTAPGVVFVQTITGPPVTVWTGNAIDPLLQDQMLKSQEYLKITVRFVPNTERTASPILKNWRQSYSCVPAE